MKYHTLKQRFEPYADVVVFMITLMAANWFWKLTVSGDEDGELVTWLGLDITAPFEWLSCHVAEVVYRLVSLVRDTVYMVGDKTIRYRNGVGTSIIWGCSGLKQMFIWMCLILTVRPYGKRALWLRKLWYIPIGWVCCHFFNVLRIFLITLLIENHPDWFPVLHDYIFKYLFYGMLFLLWVLFVEKLRPASSGSPA